MSGKDMSIEKIYQKKSQLEHILLRPDTYIGSVEMLKEEMWVWEASAEKMVKKEISFVPGLYKIFDEIMVNAADNKQRDANMSVIRINIDQDANTIRIFNNGKGIPVVEHKEEKMLIPTMIFGHLLTSSNYNDDEKKVTGGRNGYGAKLCNIFSKKFIVETSSREYKKSFKQVWTDNMSKADDPILKEAREEDFTCVTFSPDLSKFKMTHLDDDIVALMSRRAYDIAASTPGVKVYLNNNRLPVNKFEDYCKLYFQNELDEQNNPIKLVYEKANDRWEIAVSCSEMGFQQVSFVNSIATTKGGRHVDYIADQLVKHLSEMVNKKKNSTQIKPFQIKNHMWLFINCLVENPTFDSQTKENMTLQAKNFGSKCQLSDEFIKKVTKCGLLDRILTWMAFKDKADLEKAGSKSKQGKIKGIPKLDDANDAGTKESMNCTLIVTEGDSAKTLAVAGLGVIGRDRYGVFPLRGKLLNVREATTKQILENNEVSSLLKIIGLNFKEKYETRESLKQLRYGKLMIMTDQDHDGSHIKGLIINFVHNQWPNLLKHGFVEEFITPIVKVSKGNQIKSFYSMPEFEEWQNNTENWTSWKIKYYKGLGTSTSKEALEYFSDMQRHRIKFEYGNARDDLAIQLAFSRKYIEERKDWLTRFMEERRVRRETNTPENYLYKKDTRGISYAEFVNKELVLFSNLDNERSIPSLVDGFKPGQRKVMFTCFKRNLVKEIKVAQLAGSVAELSAYHHGEMSLMSTIINLAQNFVGSNNINLLQPIGQFGTRLHGGKDSASARYIFTALNPLTRLLFNPKDDPLYAYINDDGLRVEPEWYCPIIPTVLVNGAEGIGTGWSTKIPNYNPRHLIENIRRMIHGESPTPMDPFYKNFRGQIDKVDETRVVTSGEIAIIGENTIEITELPIGVWTQAYKENILEVFLHGSDKPDAAAANKQLIADYKEYHTDTTVRFVVKMTPEQFNAAQAAGLHKYFKLQKSMSLASMVLFDHDGCLRRYDTVNDILKEFYAVRSKLYAKRKEYMEGMLGAESLKLDNIARFIMEKIEGKIKVENLKKADICRMLKERGYNADPVAKWKKKVAKEQGYENFDEAAVEEAPEEENQASSDKHDYDYLLSMPIWNLTMEKKDEILKQQKQKGDELARLKAKSANQLWLDDLDEFLAQMDKYELKEKEEEAAAQLKAYKAGQASKSKTTAAAKHQPAKMDKMKLEYMPNPDGKRVDVSIDPSLVPKEPKLKVKSESDKQPLSIVDLIIDQKYDENQVLEIVNSLPKKQREKAPAAAATATAASKEKTSKTKKLAAVKEESKETKNNDASNQSADSSDQVVAKTTKVKTAAKKPTSKDASNTLNNYFKKKKTAADSDAESFEDEITVLEDDEPREKPARSRKEIKYDETQSSDEDDSSDDSSLKKRKTSSKKKAHDSTEDIVLDSISDANSEDEFMPKKSAAPAKKQPTSATKKEEKPKPTKSDEPAKTTKAKAQKTKINHKHHDDDDDESDTENKAPVEASKKTTSSSGAAASGGGSLLKFLQPKAKKTTDDDKPPLKESSNKETTATGGAAKKQANKKKYDDSFVVSNSDDDSDFELGKSKPKKKLMPVIDDKKKPAVAKKPVRSVVPDDDDLFAID